MALEIGREMAREMALETAPEQTLDMASELALYTIAAKIISHLFLFHWHLLSYITSQSAHHFAAAVAVPWHTICARICLLCYSISLTG